MKNDDDEFFEAATKKLDRDEQDKIIEFYGGEFVKRVRELADYVKKQEFSEAVEKFKERKRTKKLEFFRLVAAANYARKVAELAERALQQKKSDEFFEWMLFFLLQQRLELAAAVYLFKADAVPSRLRDAFHAAAEQGDTETGAMAVEHVKKLLEQTGDAVGMLSQPDNQQYLLRMLTRELAFEAGSVAAVQPDPVPAPRLKSDSGGTGDSDTVRKVARNDDNEPEF